MEPSTPDERALAAWLRAQSAHARLDTINGQLVRIGDELQATRLEVVSVKTRAGVMAAVGAFIATAIVAPLAVALAIKMFPADQARPLQAPPAVAAPAHR